jgi:nitrite reductase/ring-hydroxylating ferredoxin subunit
MAQHPRSLWCCRCFCHAGLFIISIIIMALSSLFPVVVVECLSSSSSRSFPRTWVPMASTVELNPQRPNAVTFQGRDFIVYSPDTTNSSSSKTAVTTTPATSTSWVVCDAVCPHRLAPLSEGRITPTGHLECAYHGWTFNQQGSCIAIPQATPELQTKFCAACRLRTYPVRVVKNIIWTWPWSEDQDASARTKTATTTTTAVEDPQTFLAGVLDDCNTYTRELPYSYETLLENIVDPSHVPFAHNGLQGTRADAIPVNLTISSNITAGGFMFDFADRTGKRVRRGTGEFRAPFVIQYNTKFDVPTAVKGAKASPRTVNPGVFNLTVICTPTRPGWSRVRKVDRFRDGKRAFFIAHALYRSWSKTTTT